MHGVVVVFLFFSRLLINAGFFYSRRSTWLISSLKDVCLIFLSICFDYMLL